MSSWKARPRLIVTLCLFSLLLYAARSRASEATYVSFQVPGSMGTYPMSVNNSMAVTGYYYASSTLVRGFVRQADGTFSTFDAVGSAYTEPEGINDAGEITGYYLADLGLGLVPHGFLRYADGRIITFGPPCVNVCNTSQPVSIDSFGNAAGTYSYAALGLAGGFTRIRSGSFTNSGSGLGAQFGLVDTNINDSGTVAGFYAPTTGGIASFIEDAHGYLTGGILVPAPDSNAPYTGFEATVAEGINAGGALVGWYAGCNNPCTANPLETGGFVLSPHGEFTLFSPPGALVIVPRPNYPTVQRGVGPIVSGSATAAPHRLSINQPGSITGSYTDTAGAQHGFVRNPYGTITSFDPPRGHQTTATSINDDGVITGTYLWVGANQPPVGFLRIPYPQP
jgi:hypothetical protein